jgi:predicted acetyltransferase
VFGWRRDERLRLIPPAPEWESRYLAAVIEYRAAGLDLEYDYPDEGEPFSLFCHRLRHPVLRTDQAPFSIFWLVAGRDFLGRLCLRHTLTPSLLRLGGHIGYVIRPSRWRQGYGTRILALGLREARSLGLERVLVTCDADNVASRRIIEANGGVLENRIEHKLRFWIDLGV